MAKQAKTDNLSGKGNQYVNLPLNGKLITAIDGTELGEGDFQVLKNMRYGAVSPLSISGMTKINSNVINATYLKPRGGYHFRKYLPNESHLLVQSWNTGLTAGLVYENTTAIPAVGDFTVAPLWTDTASSNVGYFSEAPDGCMIYCNGKDSCVWGGNEYRTGGLIVGDLEETIKYDYTERITNTLTDAPNVATITKAGTSSGIDANTLLMLHCDGANGGVTFTDSSLTTPHTVTAVGNANTSTAQFKFGTASGLFDGTGDYLTIPDNADFDLSGGTWSVDKWVRITPTIGTTMNLYYQGTDANNYMQLYALRDTPLRPNQHKFGIKIVAASATVVTLLSPAQEVQGAWHHVEFTENGDNWYIFLDGSLIASTADTSRAANYTGLVYIGANSGGTDAYNGYIDEIRLSNTARHTANFSVSTTPYSGTANAYAFVASTRPIKGIKWYVGTANTTPCVPIVSYWANSTWTPTTNLVDGTASPAGTSLGKTGSMTFDTTVTLAKPRVYNSVYAYWYLIAFPAIDNTTTVYFMTLDAPMQQLVDLWDGSARPIMNYFKYVSSYTDETTNVIYQDYLSTDALTYSDLGSFATTSYVLAAFAERMTGAEITLASGTANTTVGTVTPYYWDGDSWVELSGVNDKTSGSSASLNQSGTITWDSPSEALEFKSSFSSSENWYFYKFAWSSTMSASVKIDLITGITASKTIKSYSYPVMWQNRVWLLDEYQGYRNSARCSAQDTVCVFNGSDSTALYFGGDEPLVCGATLFTRFGGSVYDNLVTLKKKEAWLVDGSDPTVYVKYKISEEYGCVAPGTLKKVDLGYEVAAGLTKHILIWQAENAICAFDGNAVIDISHDIKNFFDVTATECIPTAMLSKSYAFYDSTNYEYHWVFASGSGATTLNKEFVYDLLKKKWYEIDRGAGKYLQIGIEVMDAYGKKYTYGSIDTGYIERLEYGNTFDGTNIISQFTTRDIPFAGWNFETMVRHFRLIMVAKATSTAKVVVTHYGDTILTSTESTTNAFAVLNAIKRVLKPTESIHWGPNLYHSFNCSLTTSNEAVAFEPIGIGIIYKPIRESIL